MTTGFWWVLFSLVLYGALHSLLASRRFKAALTRRFGPPAMRWHRLLFSLQAGLLFLPVLVLVNSLPDRTIYAVSAPFSTLLRLLQLAGISGLVYSVGQTGFFNFIGLNRLLDPAALNQPPRLVTSGLYRHVRHPIYTSTMLLLWATPVLSWNQLALNLGISGYMIIGSLFEEQKLLDEFGSAYREFSRRTPAFLPRLKRAREE